MKRLLMISLVVLAPVLSKAATDLKLLMEKEAELKVMLDSLRSAKNDMSRINWNIKFKELLTETIHLEGAFQYEFDSLTTIGKMRSPDNVFRLFNWNVEDDRNIHTYYCLMLIQGKSAKKNKVVEFTDKSQMILKPDMKVLDPRNWYGCLYYKIIINKEKPTTEYTLIGLAPNNELSSKKIIEVMSIKGEKITFGGPAFNIENVGIKRRFVIEYSAKASVPMNYDVKLNAITFGHLVPEAPFADGLYEFYIPDGSVDGFELQEDGTWLYIPDMDARRSKDADDKLYNEPR